LQLMAK